MSRDNLAIADAIKRAEQIMVEIDRPWPARTGRYRAAGQEFRNNSFSQRGRTLQSCLGKDISDAVSLHRIKLDVSETSLPRHFQ
jgi:hypothetical protein